MLVWRDVATRARKSVPWALASFAFAFVLAIVLDRVRAPAPQPDAPRASFEIVTGTGVGSNIRIAAMMAGVLSNPPGISRCTRAELCGPPGLIATSRATQGAVVNILAVESGTTDSAIVEANMVARAVAGQEPFRAPGGARNLRTITNLYGEAIHLVAARRAEILSVSDLRNKRVSLSPEGSTAIAAARAVLRAYRLAEWRIVRNYDPVDSAALAMREGRLDAFFLLGGTPVNLVSQLLDDDIAVLVPIDEPARTRLLDAEPYMVAQTIPIGTYPGSPSVETVGVHAVWITHATKPDDLIYAMVRALYETENRGLVGMQRTGFDFFELEMARDRLPAPLHPGAERFFSEGGIVRVP